MNTWFKYPKTLHFPHSPGLQNDDRMMPLEDVEKNFTGKEVVGSIKMDGENTTMMRRHIHARSVNSGDHPSRSWVKALHGIIKNDIPEDWRICGENCYAHHSIFYENLETYFYVFGIYDHNNICLSWKETVEWCELLNIHPDYPVLPVPVIFEGIFDLVTIEGLAEGLDLEKDEGYAVRNAGSFHYNDFQKNVVKYVRKGHVQTDQHWMSKPVVKNLLK